MALLFITGHMLARKHLPYISPISPLYLPYISPQVALLFITGHMLSRMSAWLHKEWSRGGLPP